MYSKKWYCAASVPISTSMFLWAITWKYVNCSPKKDCRNWGWGRAVSFQGIYVSNFRYTVFAVYSSCYITSLPIELREILYIPIYGHRGTRRPQGYSCYNNNSPAAIQPQTFRLTIQRTITETKSIQANPWTIICPVYASHWATNMGTQENSCRSWRSLSRIIDATRKTLSL
jgi:hypothetical protein